MNGNEEIDKEVKLGVVRAIWMLWYGTPKNRNEMETMVLIILLLEKDPPTTNQYWTLSDLNDNIKKTYADIQKAVIYMEEKKVIKTGKDWIKGQGNKRFIDLTFWGNDFLKTCRLISNNTLKQLKEKGLKGGNKK